MTAVLLLSLALLVAPVSSQAGPSWDKVVVDLSDQTATVYDVSGFPVRTFDVSTGAPDTPTPTGRFKVSSKSPATFARQNPSVSMRYMVRFNNGVGFHSIPRKNGSPLPTPLGRLGVSHGCVRLADADAKLLYENLPVGARVVVKP